MKTSLFAAAALLLAAGCATTGVTVVVAPNGDDANPGSAARPVATLERALALARAARQSGATHDAPVRIALRGGTYELQAPVRLTPEDSGTAAAPLVIASWPGESAVLSGGTRLAGTWRPVPGKPYWQLDVPRVREAGWNFHLLTVNGETRTRARTPNWGEKELRAEGREPGGDPRQALRYYPGDVDPAWRNPTDIDVVLLCSWTPTVHRVKEIDAARRAVRFYSAHSRTVDAWEAHFRYYLSNVFEALDQPGEWYLDRPSGTLYYYPLPGEDLATASAVAPRLKSRLIAFDGDPDGGRFVQHVQLRDLAFRDVDGDMDRYNGAYRQGHMFLDAAVSARGLRHAAIERCEFAQLGEYALELADGCRDVAVRQCHLWDLGAGAMQLGVSDLPSLLKGQKPPAAAALPANPRFVSDLVVDNCCIHRLGTLWHGAYGIVNRFASNTRITHNEIFDTHWDAIGLDARWDWKGEAYSSGNEVAYNHLHHLGLRYHTDAAAVYQFGPLDTHIHHNLIHDTFAYPYICGFAGVYLDEQSRGARVENNLVYDVDWYAYFQHKGTDNLLCNNIGAFARDGLFWRGALNDVWKTNYLEACRNIYVASNAVAIRQEWQPGLRPPLVHHNLYHTLATGTNLTFAGRSFAEWQAAGQDAGSVVADPGCRSPAARDFALRPDAPAVRAIGFVPFDAELRTAGLYGPQAWRSTPSRFAPRAPSTVWDESDLARLAAFAIDFNELKVGETPPAFQLSEQKDAGFAVSDEVPGTRGPRCLKCTDRKGLPKAFYPYMHIAPRGVNSGTATFRFSARLPAQGAAPFAFEVRGNKPAATGPALTFAADGTITANGKRIGRLSAEGWTTFSLRFSLGDRHTGSYALTVTTPHGELTQTLPCASGAFADIGWLGFTTSDNNGAFYLDALSLQLAE